MYKKLAIIWAIIIAPPAVSANEMVFGVELYTPFTVSGEGMGVSSSLGSSYFGYRFGAFLPFIGLDMAHLSTSAEYSSEDWDTDDSGDWYRKYKSENDFDMSALLCVPHIGVRFYFLPNGVKPYLSASILKVLPLNVDTKTHYAYWEYDSTGAIIDQGDTTYQNAEEDDFAKKVLGVLGFSFGFGAEYYFSPAFSVSGEYGLNYYSTSGDYKKEYADQYDKDVQEMSLSFLMGLTYSRIQFNFHIGGKE